MLASGSEDNIVRVWQIPTGAPLLALGHTSPVTSVAFSPNGALIATTAWDNSISIWKASDGTKLKVINDHKRYPTKITFSPDGSILVSCGWDGTIRLWKVAQ